MNLKTVLLVLGFVVLLFFGSCNSVITTPDIIINQSIQAHGGSGRLKQLEKITLQKKTITYEATGEQKSTSIQQQQFEFEKGKLQKVTIQTQMDRDTIFLQKHSGEVTKLQNGISITEREVLESAQKQLDAAGFVFLQPFNLNDPKSIKTYKRLKRIDGILVDVLEIKYTNSSDRWNFYFYADTHLVLGYQVFHNNRYSLIINEQFQTRNGMQFVKTRTSFITDSLNISRRKVAAYEYEIR